MFDIRKEVPSLELCKRLKELGYPQDWDGWRWEKLRGKSEYEIGYVENPLYKLNPFVDDFIKAPTVRELGEWLPDKIPLNEYGRKGVIRFYKEKGKYIYTIYDLVKDDDIEFFSDEYEVNARTKLLIWLKENEYIEFRKRGE